MKLHPFYSFLKNQRSDALPGTDAQMKMSPTPLDPDFVLPRDASDTAYPSSVLVPLYPGSGDDLRVVLTLRTNHIRHAGQISFPGGRKENGETLLETALRETEEEVGIESRQVSVACSITPLYLYRTDNQITPFVGFLDSEPDLIPNPDEVQEIITPSLDELLSGTHLKQETWHLKHASFDVPFWSIHRVPLWGATAMMMSELLALYQTFRDEENDH